jgi:hypothetical protein
MEHLERHDSIRLCGAGGSLRHVGIVTHENESVEREIVELELVEHIRIILRQRNTRLSQSPERHSA